MDSWHAACNVPSCNWQIACRLNLTLFYPSQPQRPTLKRGSDEESSCSHPDRHLRRGRVRDESDPSNTVGFINQTVTTGFSTFSACPIGTSVGAPASNYIAGQGTAGDRIYKRAGSAWVNYNWSPTWTGLTFDYNSAYLYKNNSGSGQSLVVAGDVIAEGTALTMATFVTGFNGFGNPLPLNIDLDGDDLTLDANSLRTPATVSTRTTEPLGWPSTSTAAPTVWTCLAGKSYLVKINGAGFTWDYTVGAAPAAVEGPAARKVAKTQTISSLN